MMTVNSRMGAKSNSDLLRRALFLFSLLSGLISAQDGLPRTITLVRTVWHTGCLKPKCEGLRVLETWIESGWGLGITEIGRTGISTPRNKRRRGCRATPQQIIQKATRQVVWITTESGCFIPMLDPTCYLTSIEISKRVTRPKAAMEGDVL